MSQSLFANVPAVRESDATDSYEDALEAFTVSSLTLVKCCDHFSTLSILDDVITDSVEELSVQTESLLTFTLDSLDLDTSELGLEVSLDAPYTVDPNENRIKRYAKQAANAIVALIRGIVNTLKGIWSVLRTNKRELLLGFANQMVHSFAHAIVGRAFEDDGKASLITKGDKVTGVNLPDSPVFYSDGKYRGVEIIEHLVNFAEEVNSQNPISDKLDRSIGRVNYVSSPSEQTVTILPRKLETSATKLVLTDASGILKTYSVSNLTKLLNRLEALEEKQTKKLNELLRQAEMFSKDSNKDASKAARNIRFYAKYLQVIGLGSVRTCYAATEKVARMILAAK
jgi:hypothetical protein